MSEDEKLLKDAKKKLPWEDRLAHRNWKVRNDANIDLAAVYDGIMDSKDPRLKEFGSLFKKAVSDSNAPVQEKALDALIAFLRAADADASSLDAAEQSGEIIPRPLTAPSAIQSTGRSNNGLYEGEFEQLFLGSNLISSTGGPSDWNEALDIIESGATPEHGGFVQAVEGSHHVSSGSWWSII